MDELNLEHFLIQAYERGASDVILSVGNPPSVRVDGVLSVAEGDVVNVEMMERMMTLLLTQAQIQSSRENLSGTFGVTFRQDARFRVHVYWQEGNPAMSIRCIPKNVPALANLGFSAKTISVMSGSPGLVIIGGREGSGKTTTWASLLDAINAERAEHIVMLSAPIEHLLLDKLSVVDQREVGADVASYEHGLADSVRENVTVLGLDDAPASAWLSALDRAVAGQTVVMTVEQRSVRGVLEHFVSLANADQRESVLRDLGRVLSFVMVQALVPRGSGGQELVHEILVGTHAVQQMLENGQFDQMQSAIETSRSEGMIGFDQHLALLVREGRITERDATEFVVSPESFDALKSHGTV